MSATSATATDRHFSGVTGYALGLTMIAGRSPAARLMADLGGVEAGTRVVDLGCGPGVAVREAARRGAVAFGVEPSAEMRRLARLLTHGPTRRRITYLDGRAEQIPLDDSSVDVAWALSSAHHWADLPAGFAEVKRVLRPGGRALVGERLQVPGRHAHYAMTEHQVEAMAAAARDAGLEQVRIDRHRLGHTTEAVVSASAEESRVVQASDL